jgi:hypothetical protein
VKHFIKASAGVDHVLFQNHARNAFLPKNIGFSSLRKSYENRTNSIMPTLSMKNSSF